MTAENPAAKVAVKAYIYNKKEAFDEKLKKQDTMIEKKRLGL